MNLVYIDSVSNGTTHSACYGALPNTNLKHRFAAAERIGGPPKCFERSPKAPVATEQTHLTDRRNDSLMVSKNLF